MTSKYKYVKRLGAYSKTAHNMKVAEQMPWVAQVMLRDFDGIKFTMGGCKRFATEREAAIHVDRILLEHGREPVNILKRKQT